MSKRAKSTLRKGQVVVVNSNIPPPPSWCIDGDTGVITGRYRPNCWPYDEVYTVKIDRSGEEGCIHRNYLDKNERKLKDE